MENKLCCVLNTFLVCEACNSTYCMPCWNQVNSHPTLSGDKYFSNLLFHRKCERSGKEVVYKVVYKGSDNPIVFRVVVPSQGR